MSKPRISYYAHHMGSGHLRHARRIIDTDAFEVQVASAGAKNWSLFPEGTKYVPLAFDIDGGCSPVPVSGGHLHYSPQGAYITECFVTLNKAWEQFTPDVVMVDVSVEVALFARLSVYRVAMRRMPGNRADQAHTLAYDVADALFAYFPDHLEDMEHLKKYAHESHYLATPQPKKSPSLDLPMNEGLELGANGKTRNVVVQTSLGASITLSSVARVAAASRQWTWDVLGSIRQDSAHMPPNLTLHGTVPEPEKWMSTAAVVITSAGSNAIVAAVACGRPTLMISEPRPFDDQHEFALMLHRATGCVMIDSWDAVQDWDNALTKAVKGSIPPLAQSLFVSEISFVSGLRTMVSDVVQDEESQC